MLALFPDIQKRAQDEIDKFVGPDRLPEFADEDSLPYISAIVKEIIRWAAFVPLGTFVKRFRVSCTKADQRILYCALRSAVPRLVTQPDVYDGYYIPKGAVLFANTWCVYKELALSSATD